LNVLQSYNVGNHRWPGRGATSYSGDRDHNNSDMSLFLSLLDNRRR
jgi:hypothetical protein